MMDAARLAAVAKALGHPARVRIVELLARQTECRGADVFGELPLAQSTISEHLRILREAGILDASPRGTSMFYCLDATLLAELGAALGEICSQRGSCLGSACGTASPEGGCCS